MEKFKLETAVGLFLIVGILCLAYLSVKLGDISLLGSNTYGLTARFASVSGLEEGAVIEIAGVKVGKVSAVTLEDYEAVVHMLIDSHVKVQEDAVASVRTQGIIGDKYIKITPGGADEYLKPGDEIRETESALNLEELVSKYIYGKM